MNSLKTIISISVALCFVSNVSAQSQAELGNLVLKLICLLFYIIPALMALLILVGAIFIITGDNLKRSQGKKLILDSIIAFFILIFVAWLVTLTSPGLHFSDYSLCFSENATLEYPTTSTILGQQPPWADARVGATSSPTPEEKELYTGKNALVYFDGSLSKSFGGSIVDYEWSFGDGSDAGKGVSVSHSYSDDGIYIIELKVTDSSGFSDTDAVKVIIKPLEAHIQNPADNQIFLYPDAEINFAGKGRYGAPCTAPKEPYKYSWESAPKGTLSDGSSFVLKASDFGPGSYQIKFTVTDCVGNTAFDSISINIDMPLFAKILSPKDDEAVMDCNAKFKGSVSGGTPPYKVVWKANGKIFETGTINESDGINETVKRPKPAGIYDISFEATDKYGLTAKDTKNNINITPCNPCDVYQTTGKLPKKFDWRNYEGKNYNTPVRDQGSCGSCWAHGSVGAMEATYKIEKDDPSMNLDLSEQYLVSCSGCGGCSGCPENQWPSCPLNYLKNPGISNEACFQYRASDVSCSGKCSDWSTKMWKIKSWSSVSGDSKAIKEALLCHGPLAVGSFNWKHVIVLSGYDDDQGVWIIKNSWGSGWGNGGYGKIAYSGNYGDLIHYAAYVSGVTAP